MKREQLDLLPKWNLLFENWTKKWVREHYWQVYRVIPSEEDAVQECIVLFFFVRHKYADSITSPSHLMALYKVTVIRKWIHWAAKHSDQTQLIRDAYAVGSINAGAHLQNEGLLLVKLAESSWELRVALEAIADAPSQLLQIMLSPGSLTRMNRRIKRICGIRSRRNIIKELRALCSE